MKEFFDAAKNGDLKTLKECLNKNIDINKLDDEGFTALMLASIFNRVSIAEELIKNNA
ncbi:ankyrin repeat domain-containing protein, partial [Brachyspira hampsonii]